MMRNGVITSNNLFVRQNKITVLDDPNILNIKFQYKLSKYLYKKLKYL